MKRRNREFQVFSISAIDLFVAAFGAMTAITLVLIPFYLKDAVPRLVYDNTRHQLEDAEEELDSLRQQAANNEAQLVSCQNERERLQAENNRLESENAGMRAELDRLGDVESERDAAVAEAERLQGQLEQVSGQLSECRRRLNESFLIVVMSWPDAGQDIDLHIFDPAGNHFYFRETRYPGTDGELSYDNTVGPGVEIWQHPRPTPGQYTICYDFYGLYPDDPGPPVATVEAVVLGGDFRSALPALRFGVDDDLYAGTVYVTDRGIDRVESATGRRRCPFPIQ